MKLNPISLRPAKLLAFFGLALVTLSVGCRSSQIGQDVVNSHSSGAVSTFTPADQLNAPLLPDPKMTPGATLPVTKDDICVPGYAKKVRSVPADVKRQVYAEYGIQSHKPGEYEVDHLISLELGGSNSTKNLWPQSYLTQPWNAHVKDALENRLHDAVCSGQVDLLTAQHEISTDWIAAYKKYFGTNLPLSSQGGGGSYSGRRHTNRRMPHPLTDRGSASKDTQQTNTQQTNTQSTDTQPAAAGNQVWVNLNSGKYFGPNSKYYGNTKRGEYLSEADALKQGYVAAKGQ